MHNCRATGKLGEYVYLCSRCGKCYVCRHTFRVQEQSGKWEVLCKGKWLPIIFDGKLYSGKFPVEEGSVYLFTDEGYEYRASASRAKEIPGSLL